MPEQTTVQESRAVRTSFSTGVIAFGVILAVCYFAGAVIEAVLVSLILAIFLDPIVEVLGRIHFPRPLGALIAILLLLGTVLLGSFLLYNRAEDFAQQLPRYSGIIRGAITQVRRRVERFERQTEQVIPPAGREPQRVTVAEPSLVSRYLFPGFQTAANIVLIGGFVPFFVFFMLSWKEHLRRSFLVAFAPENREGVENGIRTIATAMRSYLVGNILVGFILAAASALLFFALGLHYRIILGLISGFLSLIPYLGVLLAIAGPVIVALPQYHSIGPFLIIIGSVTAFHVVGLNVLFPKIVGARVNLNPVAVTLALFVWGWMWGAMGLILAIPITAGAKAICDNIAGLKKFGAMLGE